MTHLVRDAVWWIRDYAYAVAWQVRAFVSRRAPDDYLDGTERPIVVLPGIWETWAFLRPIIDPLHRRGHPMHVLTSLGWNGRPVARTAEDVAAYLAEHDLRDVVIVAHSKGGLIGLLAMARPTLAGRIAGVVAVASPFGGSSRGLRLAARTHLRELAPTASGLAALADVAEASHRVSSLMPAWDEMIPEGHALPGARNLPLPVSGHFLPLVDPGVWRVVHEEVDRWAATP